MHRHTTGLRPDASLRPEGEEREREQAAEGGERRRRTAGGGASSGASGRRGRGAVGGGGAGWRRLDLRASQSLRLARGSGTGVGAQGCGDWSRRKGDEGV